MIEGGAFPRGADLGLTVEGKLQDWGRHLLPFHDEEEAFHPLLRAAGSCFSGFWFFDLVGDVFAKRVIEAFEPPAHFAILPEEFGELGWRGGSGTFAVGLEGNLGETAEFDAGAFLHFLSDKQEVAALFAAYQRGAECKCVLRAGSLDGTPDAVGCGAVPDLFGVEGDAYYIPWLGPVFALEGGFEGLSH